MARAFETSEIQAAGIEESLVRPIASSDDFAMVNRTYHTREKPLKTPLLHGTHLTSVVNVGIPGPTKRIALLKENSVLNVVKLIILPKFALVVVLHAITEGRNPNFLDRKFTMLKLHQQATLVAMMSAYIHWQRNQRR